MPHKYLNEIGIESTDPRIFNTDAIEEPEYQDEYNKEKSVHNFDCRETFEMDYTFATWLYEHLQAYKEFTKEVIDLEFHKFLIPVLYDIPEDKLIYINEDKAIAGQYKYEIIEEHTELEAIDIMIDYLKKYLIDTDSIDWKEEQIKTEYLQGAIGILKEVIPALWW